jgi:DNA invertase Pin-like site-specific DNA recombinase
MALPRPSGRWDTITAGGKASLDMLGAFADFEINLLRERQMEEIAAARAAASILAASHGLTRPPCGGCTRS